MRRIACLFLFATLAASAHGVERRPGERKPPLKVRTVPAPGDTDGLDLFFELRYDTGLNAGFPLPAQFKTVGNRFNSAHGMALLGSNHRLTWVTLFPQDSGSQSFSVFGPPNSMGSAMLIDYFRAPLMAHQFNIVNVVGAATSPGPDFIVTFIGVFGGTGGLVGLDAHSLNGQGFHAVEGRYTMEAMTMIERIPGRNAMLRANGLFITPVELIDFRIQ